jgi:hypothetical protein
VALSVCDLEEGMVSEPGSGEGVISILAKKRLHPIESGL